MPKRGLTEDYIPSWEEVKAKYRRIEIEEEKEKVPTWEEIKAKYASITPTEKTDISQLPTSTTPKPVQEPVQKQESKIKDIGDTFRLNTSKFIHGAKQFFTGTVPNYIFQDIKDSDRRYIENKFGLPEGTVTDELMHNVDKKHELIREKSQIKYDKAEENYQKWLQAHPELQPRKGWDKGVIETIKEDPSVLLDPAYWAYVAAGTAPFSLGVMGTTVLTTALTGNPLIGMAAGTAIAYPTQAHDLYTDLIASGATKEQAAELSVPLGAAIASVETVGDLPILGAISKPFKQMLTKNIKKEVVQSVVKSGVKTFMAAEGSEVLEEIVQGAIQDATVKTFDENRNLLENIPETVIQTLIATAPMALVGGGSQMKNTQNYNQILETQEKKNKIIQEALDKVTGTEKNIDVIKGIESKLTEKGLEFGEKEYIDIKQQLQEKGPVARPEIKTTEPGKVTPEKVEPKAPVALSTEQLEKINKIIPEKNISKGNLEIDKRKLKTPIKEIVSQYVPKEEQTKVEKNINEQINNIIPKTEVKKVEAEALQQEIKEIIQDEINNEIEIYHFTPQRVDVIDPSFMGQNLTEAEKERQQNDPVSEPTSAFYTRESIPEKQYLGAKNLYKTKIDKNKLVDIRLPENKKYITQEGNINEARIKNDGYLGFIAPIDNRTQVRILDPIKVDHIGVTQSNLKSDTSLKNMWKVKMQAIKTEPKLIDITVTQETTGAGETSSEEMALLEKERGTDLKLNAWEIYKRLEEGHWDGNLAETVRKMSNAQYKLLESKVKRSLKDLDKSLISKKALEAVKKVRDAKTLEEAITKLPLQGMQELDTSGSSQQEQISSPINTTEGPGGFDFSETGPTESGTVSNTGSFAWDKALRENKELKEQEQQEQIERKQQKDKEYLEDYSKSGEQAIHKLSERIYLNAVANGIELGLSPEELSKQDRTDMLDNASRAIKYVNNNYQKAKDILMYGGEAYDSDGHILKGGIFNAVNYAATKSGDVDTLYSIAQYSNVRQEVSFFGKVVKSYDEMGQYDAVTAIAKLQQYKREAVENKTGDIEKMRQDEVEDIKSFMGIDIDKFRERLKKVFRNKDIHC